MMNLTLGELLDMQAQRYPERDALVYPQRGLRWSYASFRDEVERTARGFLGMGIGKGDHVAIWATNVPEWIIAQFATALIGAVLVTVNTNYKAFELEYLLRQSDATTLILTKGFKDSDYVKNINLLCPSLKTSKPGRLQNYKLPYLQNIIFIGEERPEGMVHWSDLDSFSREVSGEELDRIKASLQPHEVINMQYTSGTTGFPKGVMLTHYNIINNGAAIADCMNFTQEDRLCIPVPLFHCFGCVLGVMACVTKAAAMVPIDHFNPSEVMRVVEQEKCTALHGVPTMFIAILEHPDFHLYSYESLRTGIMAGSPCPVQVMRQVVDKMNMHEITIAYGQTEASPVITQTRTHDPLELRVSTVGRALPNVEVRIIDPETGKDVPYGVQGELIARGYGVMKGYYNMEEATEAAIDHEGWLHTGDLATMNQEGYCKITGRLKDMIIRGGENIYPREIEEFLYTHPSIKDVQVVGIPDVKYGEEVIAYVILKEDVTEEPTGEEMIQFVRDGLSRYKAPRYIRFIDEFPMTASGKIQKFKLREMAIDELNLGAAAAIETA